MQAYSSDLKAEKDVSLHAIARQLSPAIAEARRATAWIVETFPNSAAAVNAGCVHYLMLMGTVVGGWMMARSALICVRQLADGSADTEFAKAKIITARFYAEHILPKASGYAESLVSGAESVLAMEDAYF